MEISEARIYPDRRPKEASKVQTTSWEWPGPGRRPIWSPPPRQNPLTNNFPPVWIGPTSLSAIVRRRPAGPAPGRYLFWNFGPRKVFVGMFWVLFPATGPAPRAGLQFSAGPTRAHAAVGNLRRAGARKMAADGIHGISSFRHSSRRTGWRSFLAALRIPPANMTWASCTPGCAHTCVRVPAMFDSNASSL